MVYVLGCITFDSIEMSKSLAVTMLDAAAEREGLELKHEDAMNRFDAVRKEYLKEEGSR